MLFHVKRLVGEFLSRVGFLAELTIFNTERKVQFGRTMRRWKADEEIRRRYSFSSSVNQEEGGKLCH